MSKTAKLVRVATRTPIEEFPGLRQRLKEAQKAGYLRPSDVRVVEDVMQVIEVFRGVID